MGLRGLSFGPERADFGFERANFGLERADSGPERGGRMYERTDVRTSGNSPLCPTGHRPFGAAAQKGCDSIYELNSIKNMKLIALALDVIFLLCSTIVEHQSSTDFSVRSFVYVSFVLYV